RPAARSDRRQAAGAFTAVAWLAGATDRAGLCLSPIPLITPPLIPGCGAGIWPGRDITASGRHIIASRLSLPTAPPAPPRTPAGKARLLGGGRRNPARHRLSAGGNR